MLQGTLWFLFYGLVGLQKEKCTPKSDIGNILFEMSNKSWNSIYHLALYESRANEMSAQSETYTTYFPGKDLHTFKWIFWILTILIFSEQYHLRFMLIVSVHVFPRKPLKQLQLTLNLLSSWKGKSTLTFSLEFVLCSPTCLKTRFWLNLCLWNMN